MTELPAPEILANLASEASENMWGVPLVLLDPAAEPVRDTHSHMVQLQVAGAPPLSVVASSNRAGGRALAAVMFECPEGEVADPMIDDALSELANILAGQIKTLMAPEHVLGLPMALEGDEWSHWRNGRSEARLGVGQSPQSVGVAIVVGEVESRIQEAAKRGNLPIH